MRSAAPGLLLLAGAVAAAPALAAAEPIPPAQYIMALEELKTRVQAAGADPNAIAGIAGALPPAWHVEADGRRYEVGTRALRADMLGLRLARASTPDEPDRVQAILSRLSLLAKEAHALAASPMIQATEAHAKLDEILARPEFAASEPGSVALLLERLDRWLDDLFGDVRWGSGSGLLSEAIVWIAVAALFSVVAVWVMRALSRASPPLRLQIGAAAPGEGDPRRWLAEAATAASEGRYREAVRCAYWAAIVKLAESGAWELDRTRTHREYLRLMPAAHALRPSLASLTGRFERIWYGSHEATADDFKGMTVNLETLGCSLPSKRGTAGS